MKQLSNTSVYRITFLVLINLYIQNFILLILSFIYLFNINKKEGLIFLILFISLFLLNRYRIDIIPIGVIEYEENGYYIVNKIFYRTKIQSNVCVGDLVFSNYVNNCTQISDLKKNILFLNTNKKILCNISIKSFLYKKIISNEYQFYYCKLFYNLVDYTSTIQEYGFSVVYFFLIKKAISKNIKIGILILLLFSLLFTFDIRFLFLLFDLLLNHYIQDKGIKCCIHIHFVLFINIFLLQNYSILIHELLNAYSLLSTKLTFKSYLAFISIVLFHEIDIVRIICFKYLITIQILFFICLIINLFFDIHILIQFILTIFSSIQSISISIRGNITFIFILLVYLIHKYSPIKINLLILVLLLLNPFNSLMNSISYIDVGQGDSILLSNSIHRGNILIDTGSSYNYHKLKNYLFSKGIYNIDYLIITHNDEDHNGNIENLKKDFKIKEIIIEKQDISLCNFHLICKDIGNFDNDNDNSLIYSLRFDQYDFLFTGDLSKKVEKILLNQYPDLQCDILKVGHHGSKTSTSEYLINYMLPKYAIISTNGKYNHPSNEVIDILDKYKVKTFITKEDGTIAFYFSKLLDFIKTSKRFILLK